MTHRPKDDSQRHHRSRAKQGRSATESVGPFYKVLVSAPEAGFELAEHLLSNQILCVFRGLPNLEMAGELEAMGFDHSDDERVFNIDVTERDRVEAMRIAEKYAGKQRGDKHAR